MKTIQVTQGSPEWLAHRANTYNASDAPAMLGCSPYKSRGDLLREMSTGIAPEHDAATERRFADGHRFEALARPLAEAIVGEDLYPVTGAVDVPNFSRALGASFDGLTLMNDTAFEHKSLNDELRGCMKDEGNGYGLPKHYQVQMEQQLLVSGAERVLFMATRWTGDECVEQRHCWYASDPALRAEILAGWKQFDADLAAYVPPAASAVEKIVAEPMEFLPSVSVKVEGEIVIHENFDVFEKALHNFLEHRLIRNPANDQQFADLELQIKAMKGAEAALDGAEESWIAQIETVSAKKRRKDMLRALVRDNRLMAEKLLTAEKDRRKLEIVNGATVALRAHIDKLNTRFERTYLAYSMVPADFGGVVRGLKSLTSMEDKVATELARCKIEANEIADRIHANREDLKPGLGAIPGDDWISLFPDFAQVCTKTTEDFRNLRIARVETERKRREAEREAIRAEEQAKAEKAAAAKLAAEQAEARRLADEQAQRDAEAARQAAAAAAPAPTPAPAPVAAPAAVSVPTTSEMLASPAPAANVVPMPSRAPAAAPTTPPSLTLGVIKSRLEPVGLSTDAAGLERLGFKHAATQGAAKLFHERDWPLMLAAMVKGLEAIQAQQAA